MSTQKLIVILGATGNQGRSVLDSFLADPAWNIKALTRDASSAKARALASKSSRISVVSADANDVRSLTAAFEAADAIFAVTDFWGIYSDPKNKEKLKAGQEMSDWTFETELQQGRNIFDAAAQISKLERLVFSSLANVTKWSGGKYRHVLHFDSKALAVEYGKQRYPDLWTKTSVIQVGMYLSNFLTAPWMKPTKSGNGSYIFRLSKPSKQAYPFVAADTDTGAVVRALVRLPPGKHVIAYREQMDLLDYIKTWGEVLSVPTKVEYGELVTPIELKEELEETWDFAGEFGYWAHADKSVIHPQELDPNLEFGSVKDWIKVQDWSSVLAS